MMGVWYCTREDVKSALDIKETARNDAQVDRAVESASRSIESLTHRKFYPQADQRYFDWPNYQYAVPWRLWLEADELISYTSITSGETPIADFVIDQPANSGPPFTSLEIDLSTSGAFQSGSTHQNNIVIDGVFGYSADLEDVGTLTAELAGSQGASASTSFTTARIGVGDNLKIDDEYMTVTGRTFVDSTQNLQTPMTASTANDTVAVTNGAVFDTDEVLLLDSEKMLVTHVAGNNVFVKRAWDGSVLASHTGSDIYTLTGVELDRGELGTAIAVHTNGSTIRRHVVPGLVKSLCVAEAINTLQQEQSGYGRTVGSGDNQREPSGGGLDAQRQQVRIRYGRNARLAAI